MRRAPGLPFPPFRPRSPGLRAHLNPPLAAWALCRQCSVCWTAQYTARLQSCARPATTPAGRTLRASACTTMQPWPHTRPCTEVSRPGLAAHGAGRWRCAGGGRGSAVHAGQQVPWCGCGCVEGDRSVAGGHPPYTSCPRRKPPPPHTHAWLACAQNPCLQGSSGCCCWTGTCTTGMGRSRCAYPLTAGAAGCRERAGLAAAGQCCAHRGRLGALPAMEHSMTTLHVLNPPLSSRPQQWQPPGSPMPTPPPSHPRAATNPSTSGRPGPPLGGRAGRPCPQIFDEDPRVLQVSVHRRDRGFYPEGAQSRPAAWAGCVSRQLLRLPSCPPPSPVSGLPCCHQQGAQPEAGACAPTWLAKPACLGAPAVLQVPGMRPRRGRALEPASTSTHPMRAATAMQT